MTQEEAISKFESKWWESATNHEIVRFQLFEPRLCMPFGAFHQAVEVVLDRPVFTHEFGVNVDGLRAEFHGVGTAPSLSDIIEMIPAEKRLVVVAKPR